MVVVRTETGLTDEDVLRRSLAEPELFGLLFDRHGDLVFRFLAAQMTAAAAEDATSDTFIWAFRSRGAYAGQAPARAWLLGIAANAARRHWRSRSRFERALNRLQGMTYTDVTPREEAFGDQRALSDAVTRALETLPHNQRQALLLKAWGGLTYEEIAGTVGVQVGTVRSRIHRARSSLADQLGHTGDIS
jgi:RNA polymerase sigma factor (sigma-70 family)